MTSQEFDEIYKEFITMRSPYELRWAMYPHETKIILLKNDGKWGGHNVYEEVCKFPSTMTKDELRNELRRIL